MIALKTNTIAGRRTIPAMSIYDEDSLGRRIAWAREHMVWTDSNGNQCIGMDQHEFGRRLRTQGTVTGVRNVYVSQMENNHNRPSLTMLLKIAEVTGVPCGFLLMEVDYPYSQKGMPLEPVYFSPEADTAAQLIDDVKDDEERERMLAVIRALAATAKTYQGAPSPQSRRVTRQPQPRNEFARRLVASENIPADSGGVRV
jgi:transcriptional regulator with XRE-family HTH domain